MSFWSLCAEADAERRSAPPAAVRERSPQFAASTIAATAWIAKFAPNRLSAWLAKHEPGLIAALHAHKRDAA